MSGRHHKGQSLNTNSLSIRPEKRRLSLTILLIALWTMALAAVPLRNLFEKPAWDVRIYLQGVDSVRAGHDPYADAIAVQRTYHDHRELLPAAMTTPFSYVYSPITLPVLRFVATHPLWLSGVLYWSLYALGVFAQIWAGFQLADSTEARVFLFCLPAAAFFPGLLASDILWSGNVAFILYGAALFCAVLGWRRNRWTWFYLAVIAASCVKAPLLSLLVIPPLSAPRQWLRATAAAAIGLALFAAQPLLWPSLFKHYLQAVELQFSFNRDFGSSPAGIVSGILFDHHLPYSPAGYLFYLAYVLPIFALMVWLSREYLRGRFTIQQWAPVLLVGVLLLNPRILEYDEIMVAIPLALVLWRFCATLLTTRPAILLTLAIFFAANAIAYQNWQIWKLTEGPLLVVFFSIGVWTLLHPRHTPNQIHAPVSQAPLTALV
jgi:hypothetical protein